MKTKFWRLRGRAFRYMAKGVKGLKTVPEGWAVKRQGGWTAVEIVLPSRIWQPERDFVIKELVKEVERVLVF